MSFTPDSIRVGFCPRTGPPTRVAAQPQRKWSNCRWVKPKLVCQVAFLEWTDAGHLRHCTFVAMRDDKKPAEVIRETRLPGVTPEGTSVPTYAEPPLGRIVQRAIARNP